MTEMFWNAGLNIANFVMASLVIVTMVLTIVMVNAVSNRQIAKLQRLDVQDMPPNGNAH